MSAARKLRIAQVVGVLALLFGVVQMVGFRVGTNDSSLLGSMSIVGGALLYAVARIASWVRS